MSEIIGGDADMIGGTSRCLEMFRWATLDDVDRPAISDWQHSGARRNLMFYVDGLLQELQ